MTKKVFMVAVEASGEALGASLLEASRQAGLALEFSGVVGTRLQQMGVTPLFDGEVLAVVGLVEVLGKFLQIRTLLQHIDQYLQSEHPDLVVLIDHPEFNLRVAAKAKQYGIPVLYYVSPQVWAWRAGRIHKIAKLVDHMMVLFPFEAPLYQQAGVPVTVVEHPLLRKTADAMDQQAARARLGLPLDGAYVAMLPGSRRSEIQRLVPKFAEIAACLRAHKPDIHLLTPLAQPEHLPLFQQLWQAAGVDTALPTLLQHQAQDVLLAADVAVVASGTATLECALLQRPAVVVYRLHPLSYAIARHLVKLPHIALPNIILQQRVYPEFIQDALQAPAVADALLEILSEGGQQQLAALQPLRSLLHGEGPEAVVKTLRELLT